MKTDIFEDMKECIGCNDVSDLPYRKREVWEEIKRQLPLKYPKEQLEKFSHYAPNYISKINDFSADISSSALSLGTKIVLPDSNSKGKDSVDLIRDSLFSIQVKQPWLLLQYGESDIETLDSERVESLLSESPDTDDREDVVIEEIEDKDNDYLSVTKTMTRLGMVVFLFIFNIGISAFVFLLTGMMIFSQVLFIIYAMFLPISFILSMIPTYEGMAKRLLRSCSIPL